MDFTQAGLLALGVYVLTKLANEQWPNGIPSRLKILLSLAFGVAVVFAVGATVWAHEQVIGGQNLDNLDASSKAVAGVLLGAGAVGIDTVLKTIRNVGENDPTT